MDVKFDNNGAVFDCVIVAGLVGMGFSSSRNHLVSPAGINDTIRPVVGWWMYSKLDEEAQRRRAERRRRAEQKSLSTAAVVPVIIVPEQRSRERRRTTDMQYTTPPTPPTPTTMRWIADQSGIGGGPSRDVAIPSIPVSTPNSTRVLARRNSESATAKAGRHGVSSVPTPNAEPVRNRRTSFWKRVLKF